MKELPSIPNDTDVVHDLGEKPIPLQIKTGLGHTKVIRTNEGAWYKSDRHIIFDTNKGYSDVYCPKTRHLYRHTICCPNKFALVCRGCNSTI